MIFTMKYLKGGPGADLALSSSSPVVVCYDIPATPRAEGMKALFIWPTGH